MHKIISIDGFKRTQKGNFLITYMTLDDGSEVSGVGKFKKGDMVEGPWWDERLNKARVRLARREQDGPTKHT